MEKVVSDFITNTCRVRPKPNGSRFGALILRAVTDNKPINGIPSELSLIATSSGSSSEFFIEPMLPTVGDVDIMYHVNNMLAVPAGYDVPRCLPVEFHRQVDVYEIFNCTFPCYVYAKALCRLTKRSESDLYKVTAVSTTEHLFMLPQLTERKGPADCQMNTAVVARRYPHLPLDLVFCIRCLDWPPQAAEWQRRSRRYGWPDTITINSVVANGCDLVRKSHPRCRQDELQSRVQMRLSFSRAETTLLNSWTSKQQLVYHVLRFVVKALGLYDSDTFSNYISKTTMLWFCELTEQRYWNSVCLISICTEVIVHLAKLLWSREIKMYFVQENNLYDDIEAIPNAKIQLIASTLGSMTDEKLSTILISTYIPDCVRECACFITALFDENSANSALCDMPTKLEVVVGWVKSTENEVSFDDINTFCITIAGWMQRHSPTVRVVQYFNAELETVDSRLCSFYSAVVYLHGVSKLQQGTASLNTLSLLAAVMLPYNEITAALLTDYDISKRAPVCLQIVEAIMQMARISYDNNDTIMKLELSKAILHLLTTFDSDPCDAPCKNVLRSLANAYLACLYNADARYRSAIHHCMIVVDDSTNCRRGASSSSTYRHRSRGIQRQLLPPFDNDIEIVFGLTTLYQFVVRQTVNKYGINVDILSVNVVAYHLLAKCFVNKSLNTNKRKTTNNWSTRFRNYLINGEQLLATDIVLYIVARRNYKCFSKTQPSPSEESCVRLPAGNTLTTPKTDLLCQLATEAAVEQLTRFRSTMIRDFSSVGLRPIVLADYHAMYAYKRGNYERSLRIAEENVHLLLNLPYKDDMFSVPSIWVPTDLLLLVDDESVSFLGTIVLSGYVSVDDRSVTVVSQLTVLICLLLQSKQKLGHSKSSLVDALRQAIYIHDRFPVEHDVDKLLIELFYRKVVRLVLS